MINSKWFLLLPYSNHFSLSQPDDSKPKPILLSVRLKPSWPHILYIVVSILPSPEIQSHLLFGLYLWAHQSQFPECSYCCQPEVSIYSLRMSLRSQLSSMLMPISPIESFFLLYPPQRFLCLPAGDFPIMVLWFSPGIDQINFHVLKLSLYSSQ